jgi:hypothetical protein
MHGRVFIRPPDHLPDHLGIPPMRKTILSDRLDHLLPRLITWGSGTAQCAFLRPHAVPRPYQQHHQPPRRPLACASGSDPGAAQSPTSASIRRRLAAARAGPAIPRTVSLDPRAARPLDSPIPGSPIPASRARPGTPSRREQAAHAATSVERPRARPIPNLQSAIPNRPAPPFTRPAYSTTIWSSFLRERST